MKEKIILAPGLNGNELMRSLALHGVNCIGMRICGAAELARLALMRSGISISEDFVSAKEEVAIAAEAVNGEPYFGKTSYSDIQEIAAAIRRMRSLVADEEEERSIRDKLPMGIFKEKNDAQYGKAAGPIRNRAMLDYAKEETPVVAAFWDGQSRGTGNMLKQAKAAGAECHIFSYECKK